MKTKFRIVISFLLITVLLSTTSTAFASSNELYSEKQNSVNKMSESEIVEQINETILFCEKELTEDGTSIEKELMKQISWYQEDLEGTTDEQERLELQEMIDTTYELIEAYKGYKTGICARASKPIYDPAISAIVSFFVMNDYRLSAQCLTFARNNTKLDREWSPSYGPKAKKSPVVIAIKRGSATSGKDEFNPDGTVDGNDLYYAIHGFKWSKVGSTVKISDRYDFKPGDPYDGLAETAVNIMVAAQVAGVIVPFQLRINV